MEIDANTVFRMTVGDMRKGLAATANLQIYGGQSLQDSLRIWALPFDVLRDKLRLEISPTIYLPNNPISSGAPI